MKIPLHTRVLLLLTMTFSSSVFGQGESQPVVSRGFAYGNLSTTTAKAVTLVVPDFQPEDVKTHLYAVSRFGGAETGATSAMPDEHGQIGYGVMISKVIDGHRLEPEDEQVYLLVLDTLENEMSVTLDVTDAPALSFLNSLFDGERVLLALQQMQRGIKLSPQNVPYIRGLEPESTQPRFSLQGENLSIAEVLDALYPLTGCLAEYDNETLLGLTCS